MNEYPNPAKIVGKIVPIIIVIILLAGVLQSMVVIVESGHVGVVRTLGAVQDSVLSEGFHFKKPFIDKVEQIDTRLTGSVASASAASKDLQTVTTQVTVQYALTGEVANKTYQRVGDLRKVGITVIEPAIQESVKAITAKVLAVDIEQVTREARFVEDLGA